MPSWASAQDTWTVTREFRNHIRFAGEVLAIEVRSDCCIEPWKDRGQEGQRQAANRGGLSFSLRFTAAVNFVFGSSGVGRPPPIQHDPNRSRVGGMDADEDGVGGDDAADCLRYLVATKSRAVMQRKLRGL